MNVLNILKLAFLEGRPQTLIRSVKILLSFSSYIVWVQI